MGEEEEEVNVLSSLAHEGSIASSLVRQLAEDFPLVTMLRKVKRSWRSNTETHHLWDRITLVLISQGRIYIGYQANECAILGHALVPIATIYYGG